MQLLTPISTQRYNGIGGNEQYTNVRVQLAHAHDLAKLSQRPLRCISVYHCCNSSCWTLVACGYVKDIASSIKWIPHISLPYVSIGGCISLQYFTHNATRTMATNMQRNTHRHLTHHKQQQPNRPFFIFLSLPFPSPPLVQSKKNKADEGTSDQTLFICVVLCRVLVPCSDLVESRLFFA